MKELPKCVIFYQEINNGGTIIIKTKLRGDDDCYNARMCSLDEILSGKSTDRSSFCSKRNPYSKRRTSVR